MEPYWVTTQRLLQQGSEPMVRRPKLTEALLKRPPFRFIHDVVSEVTRRTGFAEGLYAAEELVPSELKDKDAKLRYLSKIINCVGLALNTNVPVRPAKILAGLEPEQTNAFLQMLGQAATADSNNCAKAVYRCLAGELMPSPLPHSEQRSGHVSGESASSNQSVSSEKLKRTMYSPSPDALELARSTELAAPVESNKVQVTYSAGAASDQEDVTAESLEASGTAEITEHLENQAAIHDEGDGGVGLDAAQVKKEMCFETDVVPEKGKNIEPDADREEIQRLREGIQALCQAISPLGKYIDYLQEDAEAMAKEYQFWIKEQQMHTADLDRERRCTEDSLQPELSKILGLDEELKSQEQLNNLAKAEIIRNDETCIALLQAASTAQSRFQEGGQAR